ncbi:MAG: hypothetical protein HY867_02260 [Chloroflexi bacterium]|nr:hypothetical protein [Chloroflexota bacterium]
MKKRLSFGWTATIMVASYFLFGGLLLWLQTNLNLPDWFQGFAHGMIFVMVFEITSRIGPKPFETLLSWASRLILSDKIILITSLVAYVSFQLLSNPISDQLNWLEELLISLFLLLGPFWLFGSPEGKKSFLK